MGISALSAVVGVVGGMYGIGGGARAQKFVPANVIKWILAFILVLEGCSMSVLKG